MEKENKRFALGPLRRRSSIPGELLDSNSHEGLHISAEILQTYLLLKSYITLAELLQTYLLLKSYIILLQTYLLFKRMTLVNSIFMKKIETCKCYNFIIFFIKKKKSIIKNNIRKKIKQKLIIFFFFEIFFWLSTKIRKL